MIEVLGLGPGADAPPELHAVLRAYGGMAEAATRSGSSASAGAASRWRPSSSSASASWSEPPTRRSRSGRQRTTKTYIPKEKRRMSKTYVIGVGMTKFDKPGTKEGDYPDWAKEAGEKALADAGIAYERRRAGLRRLLLRRLDLRAAGDLPARPDRDPDRQRQQQLLDRILGALPRPPGGQGRARRLRARGRLREDGEGLARDEVHRPDPGARQAHGPHVRGARPGGVAVRAADVRQRRPRPHGEVRLQARALRLDRLEEPQALGQQPLRAVPGRVHARRDQGRADDPRAADEAAVLADLRRRRRRDRRLREATSTSTTSGIRPSRSPASRWSPT